MIQIDARRSGFEIKGWHVLAAFVAFFGGIIVINILMLHLATSTFRGTESDSAYRDGLRYNQELAAARRQDALNWIVNAQVRRDAEGEARVSAEARDATGRPVEAIEGLVSLVHPADKMQDRHAPLMRAGTGSFSAHLGAVPAGQWDVVVEFRRDGERVFMSRNRVALK